jgi:hypothetical protein
VTSSSKSSGFARLAATMMAEMVEYVRALRLVPDNVKGRRLSHRIEATTAAVSGPPPANPLREYFNRHQEGRGIWKWDHYFDIYHERLQRFRGTDAVIAEVGVYSGGSLGMWRDYFGPTVTIIGIDIESACLEYREPGIEIEIGDQGDPAFWRRFKAKYPRLDAVIDDGGHQPLQQRVTLESLLAHLAPGGEYICEDIHGVTNPFFATCCGLMGDLQHFARSKHADGVTSRANAIQSLVKEIRIAPYIVAIERTGHPVITLVSRRHGTEWQGFLRWDAAQHSPATPREGESGVTAIRPTPQ